MPGIIVGVDGSPECGHALSWAIREASLRHLPLTIVTVEPRPVRPATDIYWGVHHHPEDSLNQMETQQAVQDFVDKAVSEIGETLPHVTVTVSTGNAAEELVRASGNADMLVVGSRGRGGFARLLMGSVSTQVTHHAQCPIVIVPGTR